MERDKIGIRIYNNILNHYKNLIIKDKVLGIKNEEELIELRNKIVKIVEDNNSDYVQRFGERDDNNYGHIMTHAGNIVVENLCREEILTLYCYKIILFGMSLSVRINQTHESIQTISLDDYIIPKIYPIMTMGVTFIVDGLTDKLQRDLEDLGIKCYKQVEYAKILDFDSFFKERPFLSDNSLEYLESTIKFLD